MLARAATGAIATRDARRVRASTMRPRDCPDAPRSAPLDSAQTRRNLRKNRCQDSTVQAGRRMPRKASSARDDTLQRASESSSRRARRDDDGIESTSRESSAAIAAAFISQSRKQVATRT
jgi:hypothetical protein